MPMMYIKSSIWSGFEIKNWIEDQFQSSPKLVGIWTVLRCIFVPNLEIATSIGDELWHAQAQNGENFDFWVQFDLEGQGQSPPPPPPPPPQTIGIITKVFYTYCPNFVILAWMGVELSGGQASAYRTHRRTDGRTHRQTDAGNDNTRRPKLASGKKTTYIYGMGHTTHLVAIDGVIYLVPYHTVKSLQWTADEAPEWYRTDIQATQVTAASAAIKLTI